MTDDRLEEMLRRMRPAGPPPELRDRIVAGVRQPRAWPWAIAAAALLALTVTAHLATARSYRETGHAVAPSGHGADQRGSEEINALVDALGGDEALRRTAELWAAEERRRGVANQESDR